MLLIAEISDKMPTIIGVWGEMLLCSLPLMAITAINRRSIFVTLPVALAFSVFMARGTYNDCYVDAAFSDAVWRELGRAWVMNAFVATTLPVGLVVVVSIIKWRRYTAKKTNSDVIAG